MQFTIAAILSLLALTSAAPAPIPQAPNCANKITFKASFSNGDGFANINLQGGATHCFANPRFTGDPTSPSGMPSSPFYLVCDDGTQTSPASSASFIDFGSTGTVYFTKSGVGSFTYAATATKDANGLYQFVQQDLCPV